MIRLSTLTGLKSLSVAVILVGSLLLTGCGESDSSVIPEKTNPFLEARVGTDSTLEVATWNIEHFAKSGEVTTDLVIQAIEAMDADIIAMQEIESYQDFQRVKSGLVGRDGYKASSAYGDLNLAYIYKTDGPLEVESIYEILTDESRALPRRPLVLEGTFNGLPLVIINNHYKCCGNGSLNEDNDWDEETRRRDASLLLESYIDTHYADRRVILVGDLNDEITDDPNHPTDPGDNVFANFLARPDRFRFVDMAIAEGSSFGWSFPGYPSHIDHILITSELFADFDGSDTEVQVAPLYAFVSGGFGGYDRNISDHLPVVLKLKLIP